MSGDGAFGENDHRRRQRRPRGNCNRPAPAHTARPLSAHVCACARVCAHAFGTCARMCWRAPAHSRCVRARMRFAVQALLDSDIHCVAGMPPQLPFHLPCLRSYCVFAEHCTRLGRAKFPVPSLLQRVSSRVARINRGAPRNNMPAGVNVCVIEGRSLCDRSPCATEWLGGAGERSEKRLEAATGTA